MTEASGKWGSFLERRWFWTLLLHSFLLQALVIQLRMGTTYQAVGLGLDGFWIGVIGGAFGIVPAFAGIYLGRFIGRFGEAPSFIVGSCVVLISAITCKLEAVTVGTLSVSNALLGLGQFICLAGQHSAVAHMQPPERRANNFGHLTVSISFAQAVGPLAVGIIGGDSLLPDTGSIFTMGIFGSIVMLGVAFLTRMPSRTPEPAERGIGETAKALFRTDGFMLATFASVVLFSAMDLLVIYLPLFGAERGIDALAMGWLLSIRAIASFCSRLMFGVLLALMKRPTLLVAGTLLAGTSMAALPLFSESVMMGVTLFLLGFGLGVGGPLTIAWVSDIVPVDMRASGLALRLGANRMGQVTVPIFVGMVVSGVGATGVLMVTALALFGTALLTAGHFHCRPGQ